METKNPKFALFDFTCIKITRSWARVLRNHVL